MAIDLTKNVPKDRSSLSLTAEDGVVGAIHASSFITALQCLKQIPSPPSNSPVQLMDDGRMGEHDYTRWPQYYQESAPHLAVIPLRPDSEAEPNHPYKDHSCIWSNIREEDVKWEGNSSLSGVGLLNKPILTQFENAVDFLVSEANTYLEGPVSSTFQSFAKLRIARLQALRDRLKRSRKDMLSIRVTVSGLQRIWLDLAAGIRYMQFYQPVMDGLSPVLMPINRIRVLGAFTDRLDVVEMFRSTAVPIYFIRPITDFADQLILTTCSIKRPPSSRKASTSFRDIYGSGISATSSVAGPSRHQATQSHYRHLQRHGSHPGTSKHKKIAKPDQKLFQELTGVDVAPPIPAWANANETVNLESTRFIAERPQQSTYYFPPPNLFINANADRQSLYFAQFRHLRDALIFRVESPFSDRVALRPQEWRDILALAISSKECSPVAGSRSKVAFQVAKDLLGKCFELQGVALDLIPSSTLSLAHAQRQQILWEVCELNFRTDEDQRLELDHVTALANIFPEQSLTNVAVAQVPVGLASPEWSVRAGCLERLRQVMGSWIVPLPDLLQRAAPNDVNEEWEKGLVEHYAQLFFDVFGRPAVFPRSLP
ncbi:hypothetical protein K435DRAFT_793211 [Dendrothele bispora CBS 962.96]|uniref:Uncharacterized protein n=1 Tax=Dendrothele bispora (strain CBS 962.96) TaxID=1314807 RepID=A0A4S8MGI4_DENBC|nr:hypothetical protein K435DRAFT_793211 [Dendrothele bispora CBS 962.96]